jgi:formate hydrogenlyase transcriptional activator
MNRRITNIPADAMEALTRYRWPGNIRELQNFIERAVVLSPGAVLRPTLPDLNHVTKRASASAALTFADAAREHILEVLDQTGWMIGGRDGAAMRLGIPRTTLIYKMRKLGIEARRSHGVRPVAEETRKRATAASF